MNKCFKIFQRSVALLCLIVLLPCLVAVPASAEEMSNFMDLVDAGFFSTRHKVTPDDGNINLSFDEPTLIRYIDFVFTRSGTAPDRLYIVSDTDGSKNQLHVESLGNYVYRAYGEVTVKISYNFSLYFETKGTTWIYPYTCRVSFNIRSAFPEVGGFSVTDWNNDTTVVMPDSNTAVDVEFSYPNVIDNSYTYRYFSNIYVDSWTKYDYLDIHFHVAYADISSITCYVDGQHVPFEISVLGDVDLFKYEVHESDGVIRYFPEGLQSLVHVDMRVDLTDVFRKIDGYFNIGVTGQYSTDTAYFALDSVTGFVSNDISDSDTFWIKLKKFLTDLFAPEGAQEDADNFESEVIEKNEELGEMTDIMESVEKPNVQDINMSVDSYVDPSVLAVSTQGLSSILGNQVILRILILSLTMATVGYVLYGKR